MQYYYTTQKAALQCFVNFYRPLESYFQNLKHGRKERRKEGRKEGRTRRRKNRPPPRVTVLPPNNYPPKMAVRVAFKRLPGPSSFAVTWFNGNKLWDFKGVMGGRWEVMLLWMLIFVQLTGKTCSYDS